MGYIESGDHGGDGYDVGIRQKRLEGGGFKAGVTSGFCLHLEKILS